MSQERRTSRRRFITGTGAGLCALGLGAQAESMPRSTGAKMTSRREVRVLSVTRQGVESEDIVGGMIEQIKSAPYDADIICLPESFSTSVKTAEEVPGMLTEKFGVIAKELASYLICPMHISREGRVFNSAVLLDRRGEVVGQYDKIHPVSTECEAGVTPGNTPPPVFETDFGTIGIQICFDVNWLKEWEVIKQQGAEIVFWPSAFIGGRMLSAMAWMFKYYVVGCCRRDPSQIYDITGDLIASSGSWEHWAYAVLNLEKALIEIAYNSRILRELKRNYGDKVSVEYYHDEDWVIIESRTPELRISDLLAEYDLIPHWDYIKNEEELQDRYRG